MPESFDDIPRAAPALLDGEPALGPGDYTAQAVEELIGDARENLRMHIADAKQYLAEPYPPDQLARLGRLLDALRLAWEGLP